MITPTQDDGQTIDPNAKEAVLMLSYSYLQFNKADKALVLLSALQEVHENDISVLSLLAYSQIQVGHLDKAMKTLDLLAALQWHTKEFYLLKTQALQAMDNRAAAREAFEAYCDARQKEETF